MGRWDDEAGGDDSSGGGGDSGGASAPADDTPVSSAGAGPSEDSGGEYSPPAADDAQQQQTDEEEEKKKREAQQLEAEEASFNDNGSGGSEQPAETDRGQAVHSTRGLAGGDSPNPQDAGPIQGPPQAPPKTGDEQQTDNNPAEVVTGSTDAGNYQAPGAAQTPSQAEGQQEASSNTGPAAYLSGADGAGIGPYVNQIHQMVDPDNSMPPSERNVLAIDRVAKDPKMGGLDAASDLLGHYGSMARHYFAAAGAAAQDNNWAQAAHYGSMGYNYVPDGVNVAFQPTPGGVTAQIAHDDPQLPPHSVMLSGSQFNNMMRSNVWDEAQMLGIGHVLDKAQGKAGQTMSDAPPVGGAGAQLAQNSPQDDWFSARDNQAKGAPTSQPQEGDINSAMGSAAQETPELPKVGDTVENRGDKIGSRELKPEEKIARPWDEPGYSAPAQHPIREPGASGGNETNRLNEQFKEGARDLHKVLDAPKGTDFDPYIQRGDTSGLSSPADSSATDAGKKIWEAAHPGQKYAEDGSQQLSQAPASRSLPVATQAPPSSTRQPNAKVIEVNPQTGGDKRGEGTVNPDGTKPSTKIIHPDDGFQPPNPNAGRRAENWRDDLGRGRQSILDDGQAPRHAGMVQPIVPKSGGVNVTDGRSGRVTTQYPGTDRPDTSYDTRTGQPTTNDKIQANNRLTPDEQAREKQLQDQYRPPQMAGDKDISKAPASRGVKVGDQQDRPHYFEGNVDVNGQKFSFGTGGFGRGSVPFGDHTITRFTDAATRTSEGHNFGHDAFELKDMHDPKLNDVRDGMLIHEQTANHSTPQAPLGSSGCIAIPHGQWAEFKDSVNKILDEHGSAKLSVKPDGTASVTPPEGAGAAGDEYKPPQFAGDKDISQGAPKQAPATPKDAAQRSGVGNALNNLGSLITGRRDNLDQETKAKLEQRDQQTVPNQGATPQAAPAPTRRPDSLSAAEAKIMGGILDKFAGKPIADEAKRQFEQETGIPWDHASQLSPSAHRDPEGNKIAREKFEYDKGRNAEHDALQRDQFDYQKQRDAAQNQLHRNQIHAGERNSNRAAQAHLQAAKMHAQAHIQAAAMAAKAKRAAAIWQRYAEHEKAQAAERAARAKANAEAVASQNHRRK